MPPGPEVDDALAAHLATMTAVVGEEGFGALLADVSRARDRFAAVLECHGGTAGAIAALRARLGVVDGATAEGVLAEASADGAFARLALTRAVRVLTGGTVTDQRRAQTIATWLDADHEGRTAGFGTYRRAFLREDGAALQRLITKKLGDAHPEAAEALGLEQERIGAVVERWNAARVAESSAALIEVASRHLGFYGAEKTRHAVLDYGDQIAISRSLLARAGIAPWVLYKLDGGLDHLLIDEAQDTSPSAVGRDRGAWRKSSSPARVPARRRALSLRSATRSSRSSASRAPMPGRSPSPIGSSRAGPRPPRGRGNRSPWPSPSARPQRCSRRSMPCSRSLRRVPASQYRGRADPPPGSSRGRRRPGRAVAARCARRGGADRAVVVAGGT